MKMKASKVQPVWADTVMNRRRIQEMLAKGMAITEIGRAFGVSRMRIERLVAAVRAKVQKPITNREDLVWLLTGYTADGTIFFKGVSGFGANRVPEVYQRDHYPYHDAIKAPFVKNFGKAIRHFARNGKQVANAGPIQLPLSMMREFGFTKKEIKMALSLAL